MERLNALLDWLRKNIHSHGKRYDASELCKKVTGETLNFKYFMDYAKFFSYNILVFINFNTFFIF